MKNKPIDEAVALISDMVMELHFRGCEDTHPLIRRAGELMPQLKAAAGENKSGGTGHGDASPALPPKLHLMPAETVSVMDLEEKLNKGEFTEQELAEAAFTFENELMAALGDDNAMPMDAYDGMDGAALIKIVRSAVDNICRLRSS